MCLFPRSADDNSLGCVGACSYRRTPPPTSGTARTLRRSTLPSATATLPSRTECVRLRQEDRHNDNRNNNIENSSLLPTTLLRQRLIRLQDTNDALRLVMFPPADLSRPNPRRCRHGGERRGQGGCALLQPGAGGIRYVRLRQPWNGRCQEVRANNARLQMQPAASFSSAALLSLLPRCCCCFICFEPPLSSARRF